MSYSLPKLKYATGALDPVISQEAMELHHGAHHKAYVDKLNVALEEAKWQGNETIEELIAKLDTLPDKLKTPVRNLGGGHANHTLMWDTMCPGGAAPPDRLSGLIDRDFGSFDELRTKLAAAANGVFGSGWAFLVWDPKASKLGIRATSNQDSPISAGEVPLLPCDVWEHAHYVVYRNRRPDWVRDWWTLVDWKSVDRRLTDAGVK